MVSPTAYFPPGDISLSDGTTTLSLRLADSRGNPDPRALRVMGMPRTSMQMTQGDPDYGSFVLPYIPVVQKDFSGGRALEDWTKDTTRYYDGDAIDTKLGDTLLGPGATAGTGITSSAVESGAQDAEYTLNGGARSSSFVATFANVYNVEVYLSGSPTKNFTIALHSDSSGDPGTILAQANVIPDGPKLRKYSVPIQATLTPSSTYWITVYYPVVGGTYGVNEGATGKVIKSALSVTGPSWSTLYSDTEIYFKIIGDPNAQFIFFEYKRTLFAATKRDDAVASKLWRNGIHEMAASNTGELDKLKTTRSLSGLDLSGKVVVIVAGPGSAEKQSWRLITSNTTTGTNDTISVSPNWEITHTTNTEYAIIGMDEWYEITTGTADNTHIPSLSTYLTMPVTDVLVVDNIIYLCQGDTTPICRINLNSSAVWSTAAAESDIDSTYKGATFMALIPDATGTRRVWYAQATTSKVSRSDVKAWGTALAWSPAYASAIVCGNPASKITNVIAYGQPRIPYIMKEDSFGSIASDVYAEVPLREMSYVWSEDNGRAAIQFGVYLFFSMLHGVERFYDNRLDDMGPNRDEGFPTPRQGPIIKMIPYPGGIYAAVNAGSGQSSVLNWNQLGWHEVYRAQAGKRITNIAVQVMPGTTVDRLWISEGGGVAWLPICLNPRKQLDYIYASSGELITSWYKTQFAEVVKFWKSLTLFTDNLSATQTITAYYQTDTDTDSSTWTALSDVYDTSPIQEIDLSATHNVTGKRIRFKFEIATADTSVSPRLKALTLNAVCRVPQKNTYSYTFTAETAMRDANGQYMDITLDSAMAKLAEWADSNQRAAPLLMRSNLAEVDGGSGRYVFIDPPNKSPVYIDMADGQRQVKYIINLAVYEA